MQKLITSLRVFIFFTFLLGVVYPFSIIGISNMIFPDQAKGSLIKNKYIVVGSSLIAQEFTSHKYFHSRFSAVNYKASSSGASNLAPSSKKLLEKTKEHIKQIRLENNFNTNLLLPADMVLESSSGLDPHISLANAMLQLPRVAKHRGIPIVKIEELIYDNMDSDFLGVWGKAGVNVLWLNLALDELSGS